MRVACIYSRQTQARDHGLIEVYCSPPGAGISSRSVQFRAIFGHVLFARRIHHLIVDVRSNSIKRIERRRKRWIAKRGNE